MIPQAHVAQAKSQVSVSTWHQRLGHPSALKFHHLLQYLPAPLSNKDCNSLACTSCSVAKTQRLPFKLSTSTVNKPFSLVHSDVWGPFNASLTGYK